MLKRVHIKGYKSLVDVEVRLEQLSVLFGPNAAGKSNFLDALQLLSRLVTSRTLKEAFDPPYRGKPLESFTFGEDGIRSLLARESASFSIEIDVELSKAVIDEIDRQVQEMKRSTKPESNGGKSHANGNEPGSVREKRLRYRIEVEILPRSGILRVTDEYLAALSNTGVPKQGRNPFLNKVDNRIRLRMEGQARPTDYDLYLDHSLLSRSFYLPHYPHLMAMQRELTNWKFFYLEPRASMRALNPVKEVRQIGMMGEDLAAFLNTLRALDEPQFRNMEKALHAIIPSINGIEVSINDLGEVELRLIEGKKSVPARVLSEGTLRILGLLALQGAKEQSSLIGFEEPENGIHPRRIQLVAELLKGRAIGDTQLIVTTHSPGLLDLIPDTSLFVCRRRGDETSITRYKASVGHISHQIDIEHGLDAEDEAPLVSERILRGDFDE